MFELKIKGKDGQLRARQWLTHKETCEHVRTLAIESVIDHDEFNRCMNEIEDQRVRLNAEETQFNKVEARFA